MADDNWDIVLRGGRIADGTGREPYAADLAITGGRIAAIAPGLPADASGVDVSGCLVMPGFVDAHVHAETVLTRPDVQLAMLRQGVTTVLLGQDGLSFAPADPSTVAYVGRYFRAVDGTPPPEWSDGLSVDAFLRYFDRRTPINVAHVVPLANIRHDALGSADTPAGPELDTMRRAVAEAIEQGAVGVSTGLEYVPGGFADVDELVALCEPAARAAAPYVTHLRSYDQGLAPGMPEALEISRRSGAPLHVSHYRGRARALLPYLDGADATHDSYPHLYGNTILAMKALPPWVQSGGVDATLDRLADQAVRARLEREWFPGHMADLERTTLGFVGSPEYAWAVGRTVVDAASEAGTTTGGFVCDLLLASDLAVNCVIPIVGGLSDDDIRELARDDRQMACSDGIYLGDHPHPRGWSAFARYLGRHTRDLGDWTWGAAARHLAGAAAERFGLAGRGSLAVGRIADVVVVDPETVRDVATYDDPRRPAEGVSHVVVAGELVLADGEPTGATPGRGLRRGEETL